MATLGRRRSKHGRFWSLAMKDRNRMIRARVWIGEMIDDAMLIRLINIVSTGWWC
jgi:hypothetical protein